MFVYLLLLLPIVASIFAQGVPTIPSTFGEFVSLLGSPIFIGIVLSFMLKEWAWFRNQDPRLKWGVTIGVAIAMPVIGHAIELYLPLTVVAFIDEWWPYVAIGFGVWVSSQVTHVLFNKKVEASVADIECSSRPSVFERRRP